MTTRISTSAASATAPRPERRIAALALALAAVLCACATAQGDAPRASPPAPAEASPASAGLVDIAALVPGIALDIRYAGPDNFTGRPVPGYEAPRCYLLPPAAEALRDVEAELRGQGLRLQVFDCYRPARSVRAFVRWAGEPADPAIQAAYHPQLDKRELVPDYISDRSGHSKGATVDLTLLRCHADICEPLDMGTPFDFFDPRANTDHPGLSPEQRENRNRLREAMARHGFENYPLEWWHYTRKMEPPPELFLDVPVR